MLDASGEAVLRAAVAKVIASELKASEAAVCAAKSLKAECGMDSIAAANIVFELEEANDVELMLDDKQLFDTLEEVVALVSRALA